RDGEKHGRGCLLGDLEDVGLLRKVVVLNLARALRDVVVLDAEGAHAGHGVVNRRRSEGRMWDLVAMAKLGTIIHRESRQPDHPGVRQIREGFEAAVYIVAGKFGVLAPGDYILAAIRREGHATHGRGRVHGYGKVRAAAADVDVIQINRTAARAVVPERADPVEGIPLEFFPERVVRARPEARSNPESSRAP